VHTYNCFFYCGDERKDNFAFPWNLYHEETKVPTLCKVNSVCYKFPSDRALYLLDKYGADEEIP
jgi:hypothetical protein